MFLLTLRGIFSILLHFRLSYKNALPEIVIQKQAITGLPKSSFSNRGLVQSPLKIVFHCHSRLAYFHIEIVASGFGIRKWPFVSKQRETYIQSSRWKQTIINDFLAIFLVS